MMASTSSSSLTTPLDPEIWIERFFLLSSSSSLTFTIVVCYSSRLTTSNSQGA